MYSIDRHLKPIHTPHTISNLGNPTSMVARTAFYDDVQYHFGIFFDRQNER